MKFISITAGLLLFLAACSPQYDVEEKKQDAFAKKIRRSEVVGEFRAKTYPVGETERVVVFDMPDRYAPIRCWVFVSEKTNTSNMRCDDEGAADLPVAGPALEK